MVLAVGSIVMMGVIPPWHYVRENPAARRDMPAGYALIVAPPKAPRRVDPDPVRDFILLDLEQKGAPVQYDSSYSVKIDFVRLALQWMLVVFLAAAWVFLGAPSAGATRPKSQPPGAIE
jgi:hypothetical protein